MIQNDVIIKLREIFLDRFNEQELRDLCFDLRVDYDSLLGSGRSDKVRELIAYCVRRKMIGDLLSVVAVRREDVYLTVKNSGILSVGDVRTDNNVECRECGSKFENMIGNINKLQNSIITGDNLLIMLLVLFVVIFVLSIFISSLILFLIAMILFFLLIITVLLRYNFSLSTRIAVIVIVFGFLSSISAYAITNSVREQIAPNVQPQVGIPCSAEDFVGVWKRGEGSELICSPLEDEITDQPSEVLK